MAIHSLPLRNVGRPSPAAKAEGAARFASRPVVRRTCNRPSAAHVRPLERELRMIEIKTAKLEHF